MWWRRPYAAFAGGVAAAALLASGCGESETAPVVPVQGASGAQGAVALSKDQFIQQGDAICGEANAALAGLNSATVGNGAEIQAAQELQIVRSELTSIQALTPPSEDRSTLDDLLSALKDEATALDAKKTALDQGGDPSTAETELATAKSNAQSAADAYGFKACGTGAAAPTTSGAQTTTTLAAPPPTTSTTPATPVTPAPPATAGAPPGGAAGGGTSGGGTGGGGGGGSTGGGGTGGTGGVSP